MTIDDVQIVMAKERFSMKGRSPKKEKKKQPGVFGARKRKNKARRAYFIALMTGGKEWADKCVEDQMTK